MSLKVSYRQLLGCVGVMRKIIRTPMPARVACDVAIFAAELEKSLEKFKIASDVIQNNPDLEDDSKENALSMLLGEEVEILVSPITKEAICEVILTPQEVIDMGPLVSLDTDQKCA